MTTSTKIAKWVQSKPLILIRFDETLSSVLHNCRNGFEQITIAKPHALFEKFKLPTPCLIETKLYDPAFMSSRALARAKAHYRIENESGIACYLGTVTRKNPVSTFDSRLTIKKIRIITSRSLDEIVINLTDKRMKSFLNNHLLSDSDFSILSPKLSSSIIELLDKDPDNQSALETSLSLLPKLRRVPHINWAQEDAIHSAMAAFGIRANEPPDEITLKRGSPSGLGLIGAHLYEDNVIHGDAAELPGFNLIKSDITGRAIFQKRDERLVIYTANKLPLEEMFGVDLIYINETRGNILMVQYKMLEEGQKQEAYTDWIFRPDNQMRDEIKRMKIPTLGNEPTDYRLNRSPFFFKFVKRKIVDNSHQSFLVSLEHLNQILASPESRGPKGGVRLSYNTLNGTYLRESDMTGLIRSGYVGTHRVETEALAPIIASVANGNKAVVLAWQRKIQREGTAI